ncbi:MAG: DHA2 family multidrug resistance protein [Gammaproteobacteria bacterium]|jgi:DHA2 family multidrug resistance protein
MILATATTATALYAMTVTIANVSLPQIQGSLSATQDQIAWIVTFNIVATAVATPTTGWLVARFGQRRVMISGVIGFIIATFLCGAATGLGELVVYRVMQGATGAPLVPLAQAIVLASFPRERHGFATAVYGMGVVLGPLFAPTLGGYLSEAYSWRWVFWMVVPVGVLCLGGVLLFIKDHGPSARPRLDWTGFIALSVGIACVQLLLDRGERNDWFESAETQIEAALVLGAIYVFIVHTLTAKEPFLNPGMLRDRNFTIGVLITFVFGMLNFTPMVLFPSMLQSLQGYPPSIIGLLLGARAAGTLVGFTIMLFASHLDPRFWVVTGFSLQAAAGFRMIQFTADVTTLDIAIVSAMQGLGVGFLWVPITLITFSTLSPKFLAEGTSVFHLLRNMGSSIHISLSVAIVVHTSKVNYAELTTLITPYSEQLVAAGFTAVDNARSLAMLSGEVQRQASMLGYLNAFYVYALTGLVVIPLVFFVKKREA